MYHQDSMRLSKDGSRHVTDEKINTCTHLAAAVFALLGAVMLIAKAGLQGKPLHVVSFSIYGFSLVFMFIASVLHHGVNSGRRLEGFLVVLDYSAIFLLIAGTITPVSLVVLHGVFGWSLFGVAWALAIGGIVLKAVFPAVDKWITSTLYLAMGWLGVLAAVPVYRQLGWMPLLFLALGGILYSAGAFVFSLEKPNPLPGRFGFHEIWHLFVISGAASHFVFLYFFVLPI